MGSGKDFKQEKDKGSREVFDTVEGFYSRRGHLGMKRKLEECRRANRGI